MFKSSVSDTPVEVVEMEGAKNTEVQWLLRADHGVPNFEMRRFTVHKGGYTPHHKHDFEHEIYIISGKGVLLHEGVEHPVAPEDVAYVPANEMHQFINTGDGDFVFMCLVPKDRPM